MAMKPPYTITEKAADYLAKIVEAVTRLEYGTEFNRDIRLHRENRMRTIHSSLAIEGNPLTLGEVTAVLEGKIIAGRQAEIKEVKNAYEAYDLVMTFDPFAIEDFLKAHKLMTDGLVEESGKFRGGDVGVFNGGVAVHIGARPQFVPGLMADLFEWAKGSELHAILKSAIVHYEIETIHPFSDGNGRMGRLWQTLLLTKWNAIFAWIPMESALYQNRALYYRAIESARKANDSGVFIEFSLSMIYERIAAQEKHQVKHQVKHRDKRKSKRLNEPRAEWSDIQLAAITALAIQPLSRKDIFAAMDRNGDSRSFGRHIAPLVQAGFIEMTVPGKPNSKLQKYRLTRKGRAFIEGER